MTVSNRLAGVTFFFSFVTILSLTMGCSDPNTGIVTGTVTVDGEVPETGWIGFAATDGKTGPMGAEITDGVYEATLPIGRKKVEVRVPKVVGKKKLYNTPDSPIQEVTDESLPAWYNDETELTYEVIPGEQTHNLDLSTKKKR